MTAFTINEMDFRTLPFNNSLYAHLVLNMLRAKVKLSNGGRNDL